MWGGRSSGVVQRIQRLRGMTNLGNTCFINAVVQCLLSVALVPKALQLCTNNNAAAVNRPTTIALQLLVQEMLHSVGEDPFIPEYFIQNISLYWSCYVQGTQQDSHEFLLYLLNILHEECLDMKSLLLPIESPGDIQEKVLQFWNSSGKSKWGEMLHSQSLRLSMCSKSSCSFEAVGGAQDESSMILSVHPPRTVGSCSLMDCLHNYCKEELQHDFKCPQCGNINVVNTRLVLGRLPPLLIIHLARFEYMGSGGARKNSMMIEFDHKLDMQPFVVDGLQSNTKYSLKAVTNHHGAFMQSGHYTSYCQRSDRWFSMDDSKVGSVTARRVVTDSAYMLWFELSVEHAGMLPLDRNIIRLVRDQEFPAYEPVREVSGSPTLPLKRLQPPPALPSIQPQPLAPSTPLVAEPAEPKTPTKPPVFPHHSVVSSSSNSNDAQHMQHSLDPRSFSIMFKPTRLANNDQNFDVTPSPLSFDLDVEDPLLTEADVIGAHLDIDNLDRYKVPELEKWLAIRRLPITGKRKDLAHRIRKHASMGKASKINPGFDGGAIHRRKRSHLMDSDAAGDPLPLIPSGISVWKPFPSAHIPEGFDYFKIVEYFEDIPSCDFNYQEGVIKIPVNPPPLYEDSDPDDPPSSSESDSRESSANTFTELCRRAVKKCIKKGETFLNSGRVLSVLDVKRGERYYVKAQVQASMSLRVYIVQIIFHAATGKICHAACCCKTQALHRCGHIAAVLILIWRHVSTEGFEAVTTTGRQCYWKVRKPGRDPGIAAEKQYASLKRNIGRRNKRDPRPSALHDIGPMSLQKLKKFNEALQRTPSSLFSFHIGAFVKKSLKNDCGGILPEDIGEVANACSRIIWEINKKCEGKTEPFEVLNTRGQANNEEWFAQRAVLSTASDVKQFLGLSKSSAKIRYLRTKVWGKTGLTGYNLKYGQLWEGPARKQYEVELKQSHPLFSIEETGLWKNPKYPQLACSPDGLIKFPFCDERVLLEIKVWMKAHIDPKLFDSHLNPKEMKDFYLQRNSDGGLELKQNHKYYYQIQMNLDILELEWCDLLVFTETGHGIAAVQRNHAFWNEKRLRVIQRHRELLVPERVLKRTLMYLPPLELIYSQFHEDPADDYFESTDSF